MTTIQKALYSIVGLATTTSAALAASSASTFGIEKVKVAGTSQGNIEDTFTKLIDNAMLYTSLVALAYGVWAGFQILTAGGDEEKVKKGRTIIIQVIIGIVVIVLAGSIVKWIVNLVAGV
jgi:hypothetical protein